MNTTKSMMNVVPTISSLLSDTKTVFGFIQENFVFVLVYLLLAKIQQNSLMGSHVNLTLSQKMIFYIFVLFVLSFVLEDGFFSFFTLLNF